MSRAVRDLYDEAAELPPEDRAELAGLLLESLDEQRGKDERSGAALVAVLNDSPLGEIKIDRPRRRVRVRPVKL